MSLAVELTARDGSTRAVQLAGGWKGPAILFRYTASVTPRHEAVSRYLHSEGAAERKGLADSGLPVERNRERDRPGASPRPTPPWTGATASNDRW